MCVVDGFQEIEVDEDHGKVRPPREQVLEVPLEGPPVAEAGQGIGHRPFFGRRSGAIEAFRQAAPFAHGGQIRFVQEQKLHREVGGCEIRLREAVGSHRLDRRNPEGEVEHVAGSASQRHEHPAKCRPAPTAQEKPQRTAGEIFEPGSGQRTGSAEIQDLVHGLPNRHAVEDAPQGRADVADDPRAVEQQMHRHEPVQRRRLQAHRRIEDGGHATPEAR